MKHLSIFLLIASTFLLAGCPGGEQGGAYISDLEKVQNNHMDLPEPRRHYFNGVQYELSKIFYNHYNDEYVISDVYDLSMNDEMNLYFSIESFDLIDAEEFQFEFEDSLSLLDAVHDHYAIKRNASLEEATVSIKKNVPKSVGYPGVMQTISGSTYRGSTPNSYFFSTIELKDQIIVVQLIGRQENMGYLYDDFIDIISSISI